MAAMPAIVNNENVFSKTAVSTCDQSPSARVGRYQEQYGQKIKWNDFDLAHQKVFSEHANGGNGTAHM